MIKLVIFLSIICPLCSIKECFTLSEEFWNIALPYFKDKKAVIISLRTKSIEHNDYLQSLLKQDVTTVALYDLQRNTNQTRNFKMEKIQENSYGYLFASDSTDRIIEKLKYVHIRHSNAKIMIILIECSPENARLLLKTSWEKYNMLNIIVMSVSYSQSFWNTSVAIRNYHGPDIYEGAHNMLRKDHDNMAQHSFLKLDNAFSSCCSEHVKFFMYNQFQNESLLTFPVDNSNATIVSKMLMKTTYQRLLNVHQYPLRIGLFDFIGLAKAVKDDKGNIVKFEKPDGEIARIVAETSNFKPVYVTPPEGTMYGGRRPNGSFTGSFGLLENNEVDVTFNLRVLSSIGQQISMFLPPIGGSEMIFVTPNIELQPKNYLLNILDAPSSVAIAVAFISMVSMQYFLDKLDHIYVHPENRISTDITRRSLFALGIMISVTQRLPKDLYKRFLFISLVLFSMVITCYYQAKMVQMLTTGRNSQNLKTLQELADSKLNILAPLSVRGFLPPVYNTEAAYRKLYERHVTITDFDKSFKRIAYERDSALFVLRFIVEPYRYLLYSNETDSSLLHVLPEVPLKVLVAYMVQKQCPFRERISSVIVRIRESGLYGQLTKDSLYKMRLKFLNMPRRQEAQVIFTMKKLKTVFIMMSVCEMACILVFFLELIQNRFCV